MAEDRPAQEAHARRHVVGGPCALAGLWSVWTDPQGNRVPSCAIIPTEANHLLRPIHNRMPVILPKDLEGLWLDASADDPGALGGVLAPYQGGAMEVYEVSTLVNSAANDGPKSLRRSPEQAPAVHLRGLLAFRANCALAHDLRCPAGISVRRRLARCALMYAALLRFRRKARTTAPTHKHQGQVTTPRGMGSAPDRSLSRKPLREQ